MSFTSARMFDSVADLEAIRRAELRFRPDGDKDAMREFRERIGQVRDVMADSAGTTFSDARRQIFNGIVDTLHVHQPVTEQFVEAIEGSAAVCGKLFARGDELTASTGRLMEGANTSGGPDKAITDKLNTSVLLLRVANRRFMANDDRNGMTTFATSHDNAMKSLDQLRRSRRRMSRRWFSRQIMRAANMTNQAVADAWATDTVVQALAEGSQKIGDVVGLITNIATQIQASTDKVVGAIRGIVGTIEQVSSVAAAIASAVEEQSVATAQIAHTTQQTAASTQGVSSNISGVSQSANDTGAAANRGLGSASNLSEQAEQLRSEVNSFLGNVRAA